MQPTSLAFKANAHRALGDPVLQAALGFARGGFQDKRRAAADRLPEFEALRDAAKAIKDHTLAHLDLYLEAFEQRVLEQGGKVHWARDAAEARAVILKLCKARRRALGDQEQEHDLRGDRPQRGARGERHRAGRDRSRRVHRPARGRDPEPHPGARDPHDAAAGRRPVRRGPPPAAGRRAGGAARRGAQARSASATSRPTSGSPAPTSWSPRPARWSW